MKPVMLKQSFTGSENKNVCDGINNKQGSVKWGSEKIMINCQMQQSII